MDVVVGMEGGMMHVSYFLKTLLSGSEESFRFALTKPSRYAYLATWTEAGCHRCGDGRRVDRASKISGRTDEIRLQWGEHVDRGQCGCCGELGEVFSLYIPSGTNDVPLKAERNDRETVRL